MGKKTMPDVRLQFERRFENVNGNYKERFVLQQYHFYAQETGGEWIDVPVVDAEKLQREG